MCNTHGFTLMDWYQLYNVDMCVCVMQKYELSWFLYIFPPIVQNEWLAFKVIFFSFSFFSTKRGCGQGKRKKIVDLVKFDVMLAVDCVQIKRIPTSKSLTIMMNQAFMIIEMRDGDRIIDIILEAVLDRISFFFDRYLHRISWSSIN